jgi:hypothetical protein
MAADVVDHDKIIHRATAGSRRSARSATGSGAFAQLGRPLPTAG